MRNSRDDFPPGRPEQCAPANVFLSRNLSWAMCVSSGVSRVLGGEVRPLIFFLGGGAQVKGKVFPYSLPSVGPGADPGVQAVSPQVT